MNTSCLSHQCIFRDNRHSTSGSTPSHFFHRFGNEIVKEAIITLVILRWRFFVTVNLSSILVPMKLLSPLVVRFAVVGKILFYFGFLLDFDQLQDGKPNHRKSRCNMLRKNILIRCKSKGY